MGYQPEDIDDLINTVNDSELAPGKWTDLSIDDQELTFITHFIRAGKKVSVQSGPRQRWELQTANTGTAEWTNLFAQDTTARANIHKKAFQEWALATGNYVYDLREEEFKSDKKKEIVDHIAMLAHSARTKALQLLDNAGWSSPTSSSQTPRRMSGFPFWIQASATEGFNGGDPSGFTAGAGNVSVADVDNWKNFTGTYGTISDDDFFRLVRKFCRRCVFKAPDPYPNAVPEEANWMLFTTEGNVELIERFLNSRNDNIKDSAGFFGMAQFKNIKWNWVPGFDNSGSAIYDSTDPVYGINFNTFRIQFESGSEMKWGKAHQAQNSGHNTRQVDWDASVNMACLNRRANARIYRA